MISLFRMKALVFPLLLLLPTISAQCPPYIQAPCSCSSTRYEVVSIVCDKGDSLSSVLLAIGSSGVSIDSLVISSTPIDTIPPYAFQGFNIKKLALRNNGLRVIHEDAFGGNLEEMLEELEIRGNFLDTIPQEGITKLKNLKALSLSDNMIEYIPDTSFLSYYSRQSIQRLDLSSNNMTAIHPTGLLGLESINQLSLDKNLFQSIPSEALANIPTLEDLSMGVNLISSVPPESLPLPNLKSLSLEVNQIRSIPADALQSTPSLTYLYLGNNLLTSIDAATFFYVNSLKVLSMGSNKDITTISANALQNLPQLLRIELSDCSIASIEAGAFRKATKLQVISLARNHITHVPNDVFSNLPNAANIDLSGNSITHVADFCFAQLPNLNSLDLSSNRLESLPLNCLYESLLPKGPNHQRSLLLQNNPWRCDSDLAWLRKWLRENGDVVITSMGGQNSKCWSPANLNGFDLRQTDPVNSKTDAAIGDQMRRLIQPAANVMSQGPPRETIGVMENPPISGVNVVLIIMACILGILVVCAVILVAIRYFSKRYDTKESGSNLSYPSVSSGFGGSSAYSGANMLPPRSSRSATNHNVYLNRPRYWWF